MLAYGLYDHTLVDLTSYFFVICTNMKFYQCNYSKPVELGMNMNVGEG